jgi:transcriptional regulator with XRE-family HTH domain
MFEEGLKIEQVAKRTGLSKSDVSSAQHMWFQERAGKMVELREAGWTLEAIGDQIGLTRERVRQILNKTGAVSTQELSKRERLKREEETESAAAAMRAEVRANPGTTLEVVAEQFGVDLATVRRALTTAEMKLIVQADGRSAPDASKKWSRQELLDFLKVAATYSWPVTVASYNELIEVGEIDGPSSQLFYLRFGSWSEACAEAGVESGSAWFVDYNRAWSEEDLWRYVCNYLLDPATKGTLHGLASWLAGKDGAPSGATVRNRLGGWQEIKAGAIKQLVASGELKEHGLID